MAQSRARRHRGSSKETVIVNNRFLGAKSDNYVDKRRPDDNKFKDKVFNKNDQTYSNLTTTSAYSLKLKNGTVYFFAEDGRVLAIRNKFSDEIVFTYDESGNLIQVEDTVGRLISFDYGVTNQVKVTVHSGETPEPTLIYHFVSTATRILDNYHPMKLDNVVDLAGRVTSYQYSEVQANFKYELEPFSYDDIVEANEAQNAFLALTKIVHPLGNGTGSTNYQWETPLPRKVFDSERSSDPSIDPNSSLDYIEYIRVAKRFDSNGTQVFNDQTFQNPGWNYSEQKYVATRTTHTDGGNLVDTFKYDSDYQLVCWRP